MRWLRQRWLLVLLVIILLALQYKLWFSGGGVKHLTELKQRLALKKEKVEIAKQRNKKLLNQVKHVQSSSEEVEAHARYDLGMVKPDEEYIQVVTPNSSKKTNQEKKKEVTNENITQQ